jgi:hypothetical protein
MTDMFQSFWNLTWFKKKIPIIIPTSYQKQYLSFIPFDIRREDRMIQLMSIAKDSALKHQDQDNDRYRFQWIGSILLDGLSVNRLLSATDHTWPFCFPKVLFFRSYPELLSKVAFAAYGAEHKCEFGV